MQRGTSNRGSRGTPASTRGPSSRGRGRGGARSSSSNTTPEPTTENTFDAERQANAAKRAQRGGQPRGGSASLRGTPEAKGAFRNKTVRFSSPPTQEKTAPQKPFTIPKKPGSAPVKSKLSQTTNASTADLDDHSAKIEKILEQNGLATYPNWPMAQPGNPKEKAVIKGFWETTKTYRAKVRTVLMKNGLIDDPDKPKKLSEAIDFKGTCDEMCPRFEQITRIMEHDVKNAEKEVAPDGSLWPVPQKMIKAYGRSSAGQDAPLPSDIRTPSALRKTLDYLIQDVLGDENKLATVHNFLWDRTRSIRRDFTFQQASLTTTDYLDEVYCLETIARFHVVALHQMSNPLNTSDDFSEHQEIEQLGRTLLSLIHTYEDCKSQKIQCDNEAEFRSYFVIYHARNPAMMEAVQDWGQEFWKSDEIQTAIALVECLHNIWEINGPLKPHSASDIALNMYNRFFKILRQPEVSYTTACFGEIHFNSVRKTALMTILSAYRKQRDQTTDWTLSTLNSYLHFDTPDETEEFIEAHGLHIKEGTGEAYLDFDSGTSLIEPETKIKQPHSKKLVEMKRGQTSLPSCIYSNVFAAGENTVEDDSKSLFVAGFEGSNHSVKAPRQNHNIWEPPVQEATKAPVFGTAVSTPVPIKRVGGFIDSDDESTTKGSTTTFTPSTTTSIVAPRTNLTAPMPSFDFGAPQAPTTNPAAPTSSSNFGIPQAPPTTTSFFPATQTSNGTSSSVFSQPKDIGTASSIFTKQTGSEASKPLFFTQTSQSQPILPNGVTATSNFSQPGEKASTTTLFPSLQQTQATGAGNSLFASPTSGMTTSPAVKPPATAQSPGVFSFLSPGSAHTPATSLFAPKTTSPVAPAAALPGSTSFFSSTTKAPEISSPVTPAATSKDTSTLAPSGIASPAKPLFPPPTFTSQNSVSTLEQHRLPSSIFPPSTESESSPAGRFSLTSPQAPPIIESSRAQEQTALPSFGALSNTTSLQPDVLERTPDEQVRYNWLAPPSLTKVTKPSTSNKEKKAEAFSKPQAPATAITTQKQAGSSPTTKTVISNIAPFLADWATLGEGGIIDQFTISEVEKACRAAYDEFHEQLDAATAAAVEDERRLRREADDFRQYSLGVKYFYRWRTNAQKIWQRKQGRQARELRKAMMERQMALEQASANKNIVEDFNKSLTNARSSKRKTEEDMLASSGVLNGIRNSTSKIRKVVQGDMAPPQHPRSTMRKESPRSQDRFGRSSSSLGHSTSSLQSLLYADHADRNSAGSEPNHKRSHKRAHSESMSPKAPLNMSVGGSRIHLMPPSWNSRDDKGPRPNNVQTDYFRLKARGIHTLPNGAPLASSAAVHLRPSLINSVRQSMSASGASSDGSGLATPDRQLKRSISQLSLSAPAKRFRTGPVLKPDPKHSQEMEDIKENARRIMSEDALRRRREEERTKNLEGEKTRDTEMEELFKRSRKLKEDMEQGEEWFRKYNESWSRSASRNSDSVVASSSKPGMVPTSAHRNAVSSRSKDAPYQPEVIELD